MTLRFGAFGEWLWSAWAWVKWVVKYLYSHVPAIGKLLLSAIPIIGAAVVPWYWFLGLLRDGLGALDIFMSSSLDTLVEGPGGSWVEILAEWGCLLQWICWFARLDLIVLGLGAIAIALTMAIVIQGCRIIFGAIIG